MKKILTACKKKSEELLKQIGHLPTIQEVVEGMGLPTSKEEVVCDGLFTNQALEGMQSLYAEQNQEAIEELGNHEDYVTFWQESEMEGILEFLNSIEPKRAQIIKLRYGLNGGPTMTLKQVASEMRLTKERIRQIEKETLQMLRESLQHHDNEEDGCSLLPSQYATN
jgi:RNA polymerase sigma factor (sigma-70 family)